MITELTDRIDHLPPGLELSPAKRRLLESALRLFAEEGYHAVSIRDIAEAIGQQPSALYYHIESKLDLLFELVCIGHSMHLQALRDALIEAGSDPRDKLKAVVGAHVRVHLNSPSMARLTNRELRALSPAQFRQAIAIRDESEKIFVDVIESGIRMKIFTVTDSFLAAKAIGAMGIRLPEWRTADSPRNADQIYEQYVAFALRLVS